MAELDAGTAAESISGVASILRIGAIVAGVVILWKILTEGNEARGEYQDWIGDQFEEQTPTVHDTTDTAVGNEGVNAATDFAVAETSFGPAVVSGILPDPIEESSQVGRDQPVPNYDPDGYDPDVYGWERLSTPNYTGGGQ